MVVICYPQIIPLGNRLKALSKWTKWLTGSSTYLCFYPFVFRSKLKGDLDCRLQTDEFVIGWSWCDWTLSFPFWRLSAVTFYCFVKWLLSPPQENEENESLEKDPEFLERVHYAGHPFGAIIAWSWCTWPKNARALFDHVRLAWSNGVCCMWVGVTCAVLCHKLVFRFSCPRVEHRGSLLPPVQSTSMVEQSFQHL